MKSYRDLDVYTLAHELGVETHKFSYLLPKYELYETGSQIRKSSKSISANIVEGYGRRRYKSDFIRFLVYAHASCDETSEWLNYIKDCYQDLKDATNKLSLKNEELGRKLYTFIKSVETKHR
jgi:four helix bundle protein